MSEFSESYHLRTEQMEDACSLLRSTGIEGYVFPPVAGWVAFVSQGGEFEPDQRIVAAVRQPLLHFVFAADHCWSFAIFEQGKETCAYRCDWDDEVVYDDSRYVRSVLERYVSGGKIGALASFERLLRPTDPDEFFEEEPSSVFAEVLDLANFRWFSFDSVERGLQESPQEFPDVIHIR